jgi:hypothetical protein
MAPYFYIRFKRLRRFLVPIDLKLWFLLTDQQTKENVLKIVQNEILIFLAWVIRHCIKLFLGNN